MTIDLEQAGERDERVRSESAPSAPLTTAPPWDRRAADWHALYAGAEDASNHRFRARLASALRLLEGNAPRRVLDLGCGTGDYAPALRRVGSEYVGLDASRVMLTHARSLVPSGRFLHADAGRLPLAAERFDLVLAMGLVGFLDDPRAVFAEVHRVLAPGGLLIVQGHRPDLFTRLGGALRAAPVVASTGERAWPPEALDALLTPLGFRRNGLVPCDLRLLPGRLRRTLPSLAMGLSRGVPYVARRWAEPFAASVVARYVRRR